MRPFDMRRQWCEKRLFIQLYYFTFVMQYNQPKCFHNLDIFFVQSVSSCYIGIETCTKNVMTCFCFFLELWWKPGSWHFENFLKLWLLCYLTSFIFWLFIFEFWEHHNITHLIFHFMDLLSFSLIYIPSKSVFTKNYIRFHVVYVIILCNYACFFLSYIFADDFVNSNNVYVHFQFIYGW